MGWNKEMGSLPVRYKAIASVGLGKIKPYIEPPLPLLKEFNFCL